MSTVIIPVIISQPAKPSSYTGRIKTEHGTSIDLTVHTSDRAQADRLIGELATATNGTRVAHDGSTPLLEIGALVLGAMLLIGMMIFLFLLLLAGVGWLPGNYKIDTAIDIMKSVAKVMLIGWPIITGFAIGKELDYRKRAENAL